MGSGEQCSGLGPTEPYAVRLSGEDSRAGGGPGPSFTTGEGRGQRHQQAPAPGETSLLEGTLLPGRHQLIQTPDVSIRLDIVCALFTYVSSPSGTRGGRFCAVPKCVLPPHPRARPGRPPLCSPACHHGWPSHCTPPAGALRPSTLQANRSLPEGQPPLFTCSPGTGLLYEKYAMFI